MPPKKTAAPAFDATSLGATAETALGALADAGDRAVALVDAWLAAPNAAAIAEAAAHDALPAPVRKAARRALQVLKARGVTLPERSHTAWLGAPEPETFEAWMLSPDPGGRLVLTIGSHTPAGRYHLVDVVLNDHLGVLALERAELARGDLKDAFDRTTQRTGIRPVPVSVEWARWRIARARERNAVSGAVPPMGFERAAALLTPVPDVAPPHPVDDAELGESDALATLAVSVQLHGEPEFRAWLPDPNVVQELLVAIGQALGGPPGDDQARIDAAVASELDAATDRFFGPEVREMLVARMRDAAISVLARAGRERAADVMAITRAVTAAGLVTDPPHAIPFLRGFFQKALAVVASQQGGQLSVPIPSDPAAGGALPGERVSEGGIILP